MNIFDTHAHYSDEKYDVDRENLFLNMYKDGVDRITLIGASLLESQKEKELAIEYKNRKDMPKLYYTIGDHPDEIPKFSPDSAEGSKHIDNLVKLLYTDDKLEAVAVGEIGLDYYGDYKNEEDFKNQKKWFVAEIEIARKYNLPIVVHSRDACKDTLDFVKEYANGLKGILHCFSYEAEIAKEYVKLGFDIGIGGVVTFKNARKTKEVVEQIDINNIVTETDSPWLTPTPFRGERNNSSYIKYVIEEISRIKNIDIDYAYQVLYNNALRVYKL